MEDRRQQIIDAAKSLFSDKGFSATGLREIAEMAQVSTGNIYNYFKNKEEIFHAMLDPEMIMKNYPDFTALVNKDFPANFNEIIAMMKTVIDENIEDYRLFFIDLIELGGKNTNNVLQALIDLGKSIFETKVQDIFVGRTLRRLDYDFLTKVFIIAAVSYFVISTILPAAKNERYSEEDSARLIADVLVNGVAI